MCHVPGQIINQGRTVQWNVAHFLASSHQSQKSLFVIVFPSASALGTQNIKELIIGYKFTMQQIVYQQLNQSRMNSVIINKRDLVSSVYNMCRTFQTRNIIIKHYYNTRSPFEMFFLLVGSSSFYFCVSIFKGIHINVIHLFFRYFLTIFFTCFFTWPMHMALRKEKELGNNNNKKI